MADTDGLGEERVDSRRSSRSRAKSLSVGDLRIHNREVFVPDMPAFPELAERSDSRLIIVANRLPVTVKRTEEGKYDFVPSSGGLASGLAGVMRRKTDLLWYGWPGIEVPTEEMDLITRRCKEEHKCIPIFMSEELSDRHYNGFSNSILWPLFHYYPDGVAFNESAWEGYCEANFTFAKALAPNLQDDDIIWVQDYHLMLLPEMLRKQLAKRGSPPKNVKIGFFLHTPFPSSEIFRILPVREKILRGLLHCDLIGFHTPDYARHFINSCARVLNIETIPSGVQFDNRFVEVKDCPIGIDPIKFYDALADQDVLRRIETLTKRFDGVKVIVGVDRLDYIKGVQQKLHALEVFLTDHPEWIGKIVLVQVAVPSRGEVEDYQQLRATVNELVGRINGKFGTIEFTPIHFMHKSVSFRELVALYSISDVCLVTSTRDGMNLVSYEYVACQKYRHGVLVLSEFAGAAQSLKDAVIINPWDTDMVAEAIHQAVTMSDQQRYDNYEKLARVVDTKTSENWGTSFVYDMMKISKQGMMVPLSLRPGVFDSSAVTSDEDSPVTNGGAFTPEDSTIDSKLASGESTENDSDKDGEEQDGEEGIMLKTTSKSPPATD